MLPNEMDEWIKAKSKNTPMVMLIIIHSTTIEIDLIIFAKKILISGSITLNSTLKVVL